MFLHVFDAVFLFLKPLVTGEFLEGQFADSVEHTTILRSIVLLRVERRRQVKLHLGSICKG